MNQQQSIWRTKKMFKKPSHAECICLLHQLFNMTLLIEQLWHVESALTAA
jgi:hypothetical protein